MAKLLKINKKNKIIQPILGWQNKHNIINKIEYEKRVRNYKKVSEDAQFVREFKELPLLRDAMEKFLFNGVNGKRAYTANYLRTELHVSRSAIKHIKEDGNFNMTSFATLSQVVLGPYRQSDYQMIRILLRMLDLLMLDHVGCHGNKNVPKPDAVLNEAWDERNPLGKECRVKNGFEEAFVNFAMERYRE